MKKLSIISLAIMLMLLSCKPEQKKDQNRAFIDSVENGLVTPFNIVGEEADNFSIIERMKFYKVPGVSIAFIDNGKVVWAKGYGYTTFDNSVAVDENTLFQAASISKPISAMAALSLVEEGKLGLDDNINNYLNDWQVPDNVFTTTEKVTLRRLLTHSAGLTVSGFGGYNREAELPSLIQILNGEPPANSGAVLPDIIPGTETRYSGGGFTVMQKLLIDITGESFPELMDEMILSKTGMLNSTYQQPLPDKYNLQAAPGHSADGKMIEGKWHIYPEMAAAGLWTTPTDIMKYAIEVQRSFSGIPNTILSADMTNQMLTKQIGSQGLGPSLMTIGDSIIFGHGGSNEGYRCQFMAFANNGQGVAIMTNSNNGGALISEILRSFSKACNWPVYKTQIKQLYPIDPVVLEDFKGLYKWDQDDLTAEFSVEGNHLNGMQLWDSMSFTIYPEAELLFFNKEDGAGFEFKRNEEGKITEVIIQGRYRFIRTDQTPDQPSSEL